MIINENGFYIQDNKIIRDCEFDILCRDTSLNIKKYIFQFQLEIDVVLHHFKINGFCIRSIISGRKIVKSFLELYPKEEYLEFLLNPSNSNALEFMLDNVKSQLKNSEELKDILKVESDTFKYTFWNCLNTAIKDITFVQLCDVKINEEEKC